jgi:hypothetical protein
MTTAAIASGRSQPGTLEISRDDGPLARALGSAIGVHVRLPAFALVLAGAIPFMAVLAFGADGASRALVGAAIAWLVLCAGASSGRLLTDRLRWTVPPLLRLVEYSGLLWLAALAGESSFPAAFALLSAVAFRQYDLVYRLRYRGVATPRWVGDLAGGWEGRLIGGYLLLVAGALPAGFFVAAGLLGALFVGECVVGWARFSREQGMVLYEDEEEED